MDKREKGKGMGKIDKELDHKKADKQAPHVVRFLLWWEIGRHTLNLCENKDF